MSNSIKQSCNKNDSENEEDKSHKKKHMNKSQNNDDEKEGAENYESIEEEPKDMSEKEQKINLYLDKIGLTRGVPNDHKDAYFRGVLSQIHKENKKGNETNDKVDKPSSIGKKRGISIQVDAFALTKK